MRRWAGYLLWKALSNSVEQVSRSLNEAEQTGFRHDGGAACQLMLIRSRGCISD